MQQDREQRGPRLHGVLVTFRRPSELEATLRALDRQSRRLDTLVVIDNDPEVSARPVAGATSGASYVAAGDNLGPAGGLSLGIKVALADADDHDWIVLLDDDDPPDTDRRLEELLTFALAEPEHVRVGGVGLSGARYDKRLGRVRRLSDNMLKGTVEVDYIGGNQLPIYKVSAIREVGMPNADLFFGFDDLEFGLNLRRAGWKLIADGTTWLELRTNRARTGLSVRDVRSRAALPPWRSYYSSRNQILIAREYGGPFAPICATVFATARALRGVVHASSLSTARAVTRGIVDAILNRTGRRVDPTPKQNARQVSA